MLHLLHVVVVNGLLSVAQEFLFDIQCYGLVVVYWIDMIDTLNEVWM